ncbi:MAG TPA: hypothetical protein VFI27_09465 [candidate division Zixibacteria bacterium]|nr:hypothetical protein [candidate division Zixibacteria bacterium]
MFLGCGCLLAMAAGMVPRLVLLMAWIWSPRWDLMFANTSWIWGLLGFIFLPYTLIMYILVWSPGGVGGWDWLWIGMGVALDLMKWGVIGNSRKGIPGYPDSMP